MDSLIPRPSATGFLGSGKTSVIVERAARLLTDPADPGILVLTRGRWFLNRARLDSCEPPRRVDQGASRAP